MAEGKQQGGEEGELSYGYRPSLLGAPWLFRLTPKALIWQAGRRAGETPYDQIRKVRISFRPTTMQAECFVTEIWPAAGAKLMISSTSWKSMVEQERQDGSYRDFVTALHRHIVAVGANPQCISGASPILYWPGLVVFVAASLGMVFLFVRALQAPSLAGAAFIAAFLVLFLWQIGNYFRRNRPALYRPGAVPVALLPKEPKA